MRKDVTTGAPGRLADGDSLAGQRIGKYEILSHLATGGMAEIYLARASGIERFEKLVVVKRILPGLAHNREFVTMFLDEARIAATLHHSNVVQVFDIGEADGEYYFCMEYLEGRDVRKIMRAADDGGTPLTLDEALSITVGILSGLHYAHERRGDDGQPLGIVHRDVSPQNVVVTFDGDVKLLDFGLVKATDRLTESRSGTLKGKLAYMSPEQCLCEECDRRSDIFSLAVVLWELTCNRRLFTGGCEYDFLKAILENPIPPPSSVVAGYLPELERIVMKGLSKDVADRYESAEEMQIALEELGREHRLAVSPITVRRMMKRLFSAEIDALSAARKRDNLDDFLALTFSSDAVEVRAPTAEGSASVARGSSSVARGSSSMSMWADVAPSPEPAAPVKRSGGGVAWLVALFALGLAGAFGYVLWSERSAGTDDGAPEQTAAPAEQAATEASTDVEAEPNTTPVDDTAGAAAIAPATEGETATETETAAATETTTETETATDEATETETEAQTETEEPAETEARATTGRSTSKRSARRTSRRTSKKSASKKAASKKAAVEPASPSKSATDEPKKKKKKKIDPDSLFPE